MHSLYYLIPTFFILLLLVPIFLEVRVSFNALDNSGAFCIYLSKINLKYFLFEFVGKTLRLKDEKQITEKDIDFSSPEIALLEEFSKQLKQKARLKFLEVYYHIGLDDAFVTSMLCGVINVSALIFFTSLKNARPTASLAIYDNVSYNKKVVELAANLSVSLSLFDVVYSFLNSLILSKKKAKQAKM